MNWFRNIISILVYKWNWKWLEHAIAFLCELEMKINRLEYRCTTGRKLSEETEKIPEGMYCYNGCMFNLDACPMWDISNVALFFYGHQSCGYCHYLKEGDFTPNAHTDILWDLCKCCGENENLEALEDEEMESLECNLEL